MKTKQSRNQVRSFTALLCVAALNAGQASARGLLEASIPAPAPAPINTTPPIADLLFTLSAAKATFLTPTSLRFDDVSSTVQFYSAGARTGIMAPGYFFNSTLAAPYVNKRGQWLNAPEAVLYGISGGLYRNILVSLDSPVYDETTQAVTFVVAVINPNMTAMQLSKGAASEVAAEYTSDTGLDILLTAVEPGTVFTQTALFIDVNKDSLAPIAHLKDWNIGSGGWGFDWGTGGVQCSWGFNCNLSWGR